MFLRGEGGGVYEVPQGYGSGCSATIWRPPPLRTAVIPPLYPACDRGGDTPQTGRQTPHRRADTPQTGRYPTDGQTPHRRADTPQTGRYPTDGQIPHRRADTPQTGRYPTDGRRWM
ncbi:hypothetical protein NHX12_012005 [Muraenolepis orangiensis]|uniref:Uncharacterized protein n=1 Tax=Muraenolepis orangiensis TaxID=630683 RepID=A0A9Q0DHK1_9TELE|nr:hypothetical protein NHX12_012005 [Muraenolepis orangiensis]